MSLTVSYSCNILCELPSRVVFQNRSNKSSGVNTSSTSMALPDDDLLALSELKLIADRWVSAVLF